MKGPKNQTRVQDPADRSAEVATSWTRECETGAASRQNPVKELLFTATAMAFEKEKGKRWSGIRAAADSTRVGVEKRRIGADVDNEEGQQSERDGSSSGVRSCGSQVHGLVEPASRPDGASDLV